MFRSHGTSIKIYSAALEYSTGLPQTKQTTIYEHSMDVFFSLVFRTIISCCVLYNMYVIMNLRKNAGMDMEGWLDFSGCRNKL